MFDSGGFSWRCLLFLMLRDARSDTKANERVDEPVAWEHILVEAKGGHAVQWKCMLCL